MDESIQLNNLPQRLLTATEVAHLLNISRAFAYHLMQHGKIRTVGIEAARRVHPEDLLAFIESNFLPSDELGIDG